MRLTKYIDSPIEGAMTYRMEQAGFNVEVCVDQHLLRNLNRPRAHIAQCLLRGRHYLRQAILAENAVRDHAPVFDYDFLRKVNSHAASTAR